MPINNTAYTDLPITGLLGLVYRLGSITSLLMNLMAAVSEKLVPTVSHSLAQKVKGFDSEGLKLISVISIN